MTLLVDAAATWRLTRLMVEDTIADPVRVRAEQVGRLVAGPRCEQWVQELTGCWWCSSVWAAGVVVALPVVAPRLGPRVVRVLALSAIAGAVRDRL